MTEDRIVSAYMNSCLINKPKNRVIPNIFIGSYECDILEFTGSDYSVEIEVKISRSDFKHDALKKSHVETKHELIKRGGRTNNFYFMVPENMVSINEVPGFAGLIYVTKKTVKYEDWNKSKVSYIEEYSFNTVKQAPRLHKNKFTDKQMKNIYLMTYYRFHTLRKIVEKQVKKESKLRTDKKEFDTINLSLF